MQPFLRLFASVALVCTTLSVFTVMDAALLPSPAEAVQATGGDGKYRNLVQWVRWGDANQQIAGTSRTVRERTTIAGQTLETTCTIGGIAPSGSLESYRPGTWQGDGFDNLYNIGGQNGANQLVVGLSNRTQGATVRFNFECSATLGGSDFPLAGLVMADAEASGGQEYIGATIPSSATWRIIERVRGDECSLDTFAHRSNQNRLELYGPQNNTCETNRDQFPGPSAIAFMDGATSATNVTVRGGGKGAIALGVMIQFDFGDAPASYGDAGAALQFAFDGGTIPVTTQPPLSSGGSNRGQPVFGSIADATITQPLQRLGDVVDPELDPRALQGPGADGDDTTGDPLFGGPGDEDALDITETLVVKPGEPFRLPVNGQRGYPDPDTGQVGDAYQVLCHGQGRVGAWIDFNLNGTFDPGEQSNAVNCASTPTGQNNVVLEWDEVPPGILPEAGVQPTYLRLRMVGPGEELNPTGMSNAGEVEDHRVTIATPPKFTLTKEVAGRVSANDQFRVAVTGDGLPPAGLAATTSGDDDTAATSTELVREDTTYTIIDEMAPGSTNPLTDYGATLVCVDGAADDATVPTQGNGPWTVEDLTPGQAVECTVTNTPRANSIDVAKSVDGAVTGPDAQGRFTVDYDVTVSHSGPTATEYGALRDQLNFPDNIEIDEVTWSTDAPGVADGSGTGAGPHVLAPAGTTIDRDDPTDQSPTVHTYDVSVVFHYTDTNPAPACGTSGGGLGNRAHLPGGQEDGPGGNNSACTDPPAPVLGSLTLDKSAGAVQDANDNGRTDAGDTIEYTFLVENTGQLRLTDVVVDDPKVGAVSCPVDVLDVGDVTTCTATYTLTQADIDAGSVDNEATAEGTDPGDRTVRSPPDTTSTPYAPLASLELDKQAELVDDNDNGFADVGERIAYTFTVTNTGATTVDAVVVQDPMFSDITCARTTLAPGQSTVCGPVTHTITQADVDAGSVNNSATVTGDDPGDTPVTSPPDETSTPVTARPAVELDKQVLTIDDVDGSGLTDAGDVITYGFTVTNTGTVTLTDVSVDDPRVDPLTCVPTTLAPGASADCGTATYEVTDADQSAGTADNTATAYGTPPTGDDVSHDDSTSTPVETPEPSLSLDKTAATPVDTNASGIVDAGDTIVYTFTVTNTGNVPLSDITVADPMLTTADAAALAACSVPDLAPGESFECSSTPYEITISDQGGDLVNSATVTAVPPTGPEVSPPPSTTTTVVDVPEPALTLRKEAGDPVDANDSGITDAGDTIVYTFTVTNTGNVPLTSVGIDDPLLDGLDITCADTSLALGASTTCVADPYEVTADDVEAGAVVNTATATGTPPGPGEPTGGTPVDSPPAETETPTTETSASLELVKSARVEDTNSSGITDVGDEIFYSFTVTNTGNVPLTQVTVTDDLLAEQSPPIMVTCPPARLGVGQSVTCEADAPYVVSAADETAGEVENSATAGGTPPGGVPVDSPPSSTTTTVTPPTPALTLEKQAGTPVDVNGSGITDAGDTINYTFTLTNTGNVPLTGVGVDDPLLAARDIDVACAPTTLAPGQSVTCTASGPYTVTEADEAAQVVRNTATATGTPPGPGTTPGTPVDSPPSTTTTTVVEPDPRLVIDKQAGTPADVNGSGLTDAGDTILYTFTVTNAGNVPLTGIGVTDDKLATQDVTVECPADTLTPGASTTCAASGPYRVTSGEVAAGSVNNTAHARGTTPDDDPITSGPDTTSTPTTRPTPTLTLVKSAGTPVDVNGSGLTDAGDTITYTFTVTNTGNVPVTDLRVDDPQLGNLTITCAATVLAPGASTTCEAAPYTVTADDVTAGAVTNTATATGTDPDGGPVPSPPSTTSTPTTTPTPGLTVVKSAVTPVDVNGSGLTDAGDTIAYTFTVTNTGNVPLAEVSVDDPKLADAGIAVTCPAGDLAPGQSVECAAQAPYVVTAADEDAGAASNTATATGTPPGSGDPDGPGTPPGDPVTSPPDTTTTTVTKPQPLLTLEKTAGAPVDVNDSGNTDAGDTIVYTFTVANVGNVPVSDITVDDPALAAAGIDITCAPADLAPGETATCATSEPYTVTAADEDAKAAVNVATAVGTDPDGDRVRTPEDGTSTPVTEPEVGLSVEKTAGLPVDVNASGLTDAGDTIVYTFTVTNTGNVPMRDVAVVDELLAAADVAIDCAAPGAPLAPGASTTCTSEPYTVTDADVVDGAVVNSATATGTPPGPGTTPGTPVESPPDTTTTPTTRANAQLTVEKTAGTPTDLNGSGLTDAGDTVVYTFTVTNTGNVPLSEVSVVDDKLADAGVQITCAPLTGGVLAVGETVTCTSGAYAVTPADVDAGAVVNSATAEGTPPPAGDPDDPNTPPSEPVTSPPDTTTTTTTAPQAQLSTVKTAGTPTDVNGSGLTDAGDKVVYTFTVTNTGNVPLSEVSVVDEKLTDAGVQITCAPLTGGVLAVGQSVTCTSEPYPITVADVASGAVRNAATAVGTPPGDGDPEDPDTTPGDPVTSPPDTTTTTTTAPEPQVTVDKSAGAPVDVNASGLTDAGDTIVYTFTVTNTGNVPLTDIVVNDSELVGLSVDCLLTELDPGQSTTCTSAPYEITTADVLAGSVDNTATVTGTPPGPGTTPGTPVTSPPDTTSVPTVLPQPGLLLDKRVNQVLDRNESQITDAGDSVRYEFTVTNSGNVPVGDIRVVDPFLASATPGVDVTCQVTELAPGATTTCVSTGGGVENATDGWYTITPADEAAGAVANTATARGDDPDGGGVSSPPDSTSVPITRPQPSLTLWKSASDWKVAGGNPVDVPGRPGVPRTAAMAGDVVTFGFRVKNTGNVPLTVIRVVDPLFNGGAPMACSTTLVLAPGQEETCTDRDHELTQTDVDAGSIHNTAVATALPPGPGGDPGTEIESPPADATTPLTQVSRLKVDKRVVEVADVNGSGITDAGDEVVYGFTVVNMGNTTMTDVVVDDPMLAAVSPAIQVTCDWADAVAPNTLEPGEAVNCEADRGYVVTAADQTSGHVVNSATAWGTPPSGDAVESPPSTTSVPVTTPQPALRIVKTAGLPVDVNASTLTDAGDTIRYSFTVTNVGNVPVANIAVDDPMLDAAGITVGCTPADLLPGETAACETSAPYEITIDDLERASGETGAVTNSATATGVPPGPGATPGTPVTSPPDTTSTSTTLPRPALSLVKTAAAPVDVNGSGITDAGDTIVYTFRVRNEGNVPLGDVRVDDPKLAEQGIELTCAATELGTGASTTCTPSAPYRISAADVAAGSVVNVATADAVDPDGGPVETPESTTATPTTTPQPGLRIEKRAATPVDVNASGLTDAGDTIAYTFTVTNTGNVPMTDVQVDDPKVGAVVCDTTVLPVGASAECTSAPYTVTAADVRAGSVDNLATATGTPPGPGTTPGNPVTSPPDVTSTRATTPDPGMSIDKIAGVPVDVNSSGLTDAGDTIGYTFTVTNTGNVPLTDVTVSDRTLTRADVAIACAALPSTGLAPGESVVCTSQPYRITGADVAAGSVVNTAFATGTPPGPGNTPGEPLDSPPDTTSTPTTPPQPGLVVEKSASVTDLNSSGLTDSGDTITYTFTVTNTGNVPLTDVHVDDPMLGGTVACVPGELAPGASADCGPRTWTVTHADVETGSVTNTATATGTPPPAGDPGDPGTPPAEPVTSPPDVTSTPTATPGPALVLVKEVVRVDDVNGSGITDAPDEIWYRFTVTNSGNVPLSAVTVDDPLLDGITIACADTSLVPGASTTCEAEEAYVVTAADEQSGQVHNSATVTGTPPPAGDPNDPDTPPARPVTSPPDRATVTTTTPYAGLLLVKEVARVDDVNGSGITDAPDEIWYGFTVTNSGNVPVSGVRVDDPLLAGITIACADTSLAPGASTTCEAEAAYVVTVADEQAGHVHNTATVSGTDPDDDPVESPENSTTTPTTLPQPRITVVKSAEVEDTNSSGNTDRGDRIRYTFTVTNRGNVAVSDLVVDDAMLDDAGVAVTCAATDVPVGGEVVCTSGWYEVTVDDERAGHVHNTVTVRGVDPDGDRVTSPPDTHDVPTTLGQAQLRMVKKAGVPTDVNENDRTDVGDSILYTFELTNTGNVPLSDLAVDDPMLAEAGIDITCAATTLAAGESVVCEAEEPYVLTRADVDAGEVTNTATATGDDPWNVPVTPPTHSTTTPTSRVAELALEKQSDDPVDANESGRTDAGDTVAYRFVVTNTGAVSVHDLVVVDELLADLDIICPTTSLASGESTTCAAEPYTISQGEVDAGAVDNVARVVGNTTSGDPSTEVTSPDDDLTVPLDRVASLDLVKQAELRDDDGDALADEGEQIRYSFDVTNTGTTTLRGVRIDDPMLVEAGVEITCEVTTLQPGAATSCEAVHTVTEADLAEDEIVNTATAVADSPTDPVTSDDDTATVPTDPPAEVEPPLPPDPTDPTDPTDPPDPTDPTDPRDPRDPTDPDAPAPLPDTGGPHRGLLVGGLLVLVGGIWLIAFGRRTPRGRTS